MSGRFSGKGNARTNTYLIIAIIVCALILAALLIFVSVADFGKPTEGTSTPSSSDNASTPSSSVTTSPTQGNPTPEEVTALIEKADFIAAGYDYQKAISMLQAFPNYSDYPILAEKVAAYQEADSKLVVYKDNRNITHIFFHSLIADTDRCFDGDSDAASYNLYMTTVDEFNAILEQMYERGYVLISPYDMAHEVTDETGTHFAYGKIRLPEGKIPFMMSQDDLNYYSYMIGSIDGRYEVPEFVTENCDGFAHKIVIGEDGYPTCEYLDKDGNIVTGDYDLAMAGRTVRSSTWATALSWARLNLLPAAWKVFPSAAPCTTRKRNCCICSIPDRLPPRRSLSTSEAPCPPLWCPEN